MGCTGHTHSLSFSVCVSVSLSLYPTLPPHLSLSHMKHARTYACMHARAHARTDDPKNIATSLKSEKFLRFFFRQVRRTDKTSPYFQEYPYYSPCGE